MSRARVILGDLRDRATRTAKLNMLRLDLVPPPFRLLIDVTDRCNLRCPTCRKHDSSDPDRELSLPDWIKIFARAREFLVYRDITIAGGEPLCRGDIFEIVEAAAVAGLKVNFLSNGWLLDGEALRRLRGAGVHRVVVSLNSLDESVHDKTRGVAGSHQKIMDLLNTEGAAGPDLLLAAIILEANCGELSELALYTRERGLGGMIFQMLAPRQVHHSFTRPLEIPDGETPWALEDPFWVRSLDTLEEETIRLRQLKRGGLPVLNPFWLLKIIPRYYRDPASVTSIPCLGTTSRIFIDPYGDVRLCYGYPPVGNALKEDLKRIWRGEEAAEIRRRSRTCRRTCRILNNNL